MKPTQINLMDLVRRYQASSAEWKYVENTDHVTRGVMHWVITLKNVTLPRGDSASSGSWATRIAAHTFNLANGVELITDEYIAWQVLQRLERAS